MILGLLLISHGVLWSVGWLVLLVAAFVLLLFFFLAPLGIALLFTSREAFDRPHSLNVTLGLTFIVAGFVELALISLSVPAWRSSPWDYVVGLLGIAALDPHPIDETNLSAYAAAFKSLMLARILLAVVVGLVPVFLTHALQRKEGRIVLWTAYAAGIIVQVVVYASASSSLDAWLAAPPADHLPIVVRLESFLRNLVHALGLLNGIPAALYAAGYYLAWSRLTQGSVQPEPIAAS
jgi:hypothetical protein